MEWGEHVRERERQQRQRERRRQVGQDWMAETANSLVIWRVADIDFWE